MDYHTLPKSLKIILNELPTPFFVFDLDAIARNYEKIEQLFQPDGIFYAVKSNSLPQILKVLAQKGCKFEVNTLNELNKASAAGVSPDDTINSCPVKHPRDIYAMHKAGVCNFAFDSYDEIDKLKELAPLASTYIRIFSSNEGSAWHLNRKYGSHLDDAVNLIEYAQCKGIHVNGVTFHVGSQCSNITNWREGIEQSSRLFQRFPALEYLNIGGGFPVKYKDEVPRLEDIAAEFNQSLTKYFSKKPRIYIEPGRFMTGNAALAGSSVIGITESPVSGRVTIDLGVFQGLMEILEIGNGFSYPIRTNVTGENHLYTIFGPSCDCQDIVARNIELPQLKRGDRTFLLNIGAYSLDYASCFNGLDIPRAYFIKDGKIQNA